MFRVGEDRRWSWLLFGLPLVCGVAGESAHGSLHKTLEVELHEPARAGEGHAEGGAPVDVCAAARGGMKSDVAVVVEQESVEQDVLKAAVRFEVRDLLAADVFPGANDADGAHGIQARGARSTFYRDGVDGHPRWPACGGQEQAVDDGGGGWGVCGYGVAVHGCRWFVWLSL